MNIRNIVYRLIAVCSALSSCAVLAADKNGVSPQTISLPSGPGSIQGLGESFQPQLNSGSGSHSISIQLPKGPAGFGPSLALQYHTGNSNGILGIGWKLSGMLMVSRNMDGGLPLYVDAANGIDDDFDGTVDNPEEIDRFSGVDLEELLQLPDGTLRSENEGGFLRYERTASGWQARSKGGLLHEFGTTASSRIENGGRVFAWLLDRTTDLNGNKIEYQYMSDPSSPGQKYCREIRWAVNAAFYAVVMNYAPGRPDVHSDYRSGFEVRTALRLTSLDIIAQGVPAGANAATGDFNSDGQPDALTRRYVLEYEPNQIQSLLQRVTLVGADGFTTLPSTTLAYTTWQPLHDVAAVMTLSAGEPGIGLNSPDVELIDMNSDGLPDLLDARFQGSGGHRVHRNLGIDSNGRLAWDTVGNTVQQAPDINLGSTSVHLADHSADGEADLIRKVNASSFECFINSGNTAWQSAISLSNFDSWPLWPFENSGSRTLDTDHNRMRDVLHTSASGNSLWMLMPGGRYGKQIPLPVLSHMGQAFSFANPGTRIADVNGDRISDLAWIQSDSVVYWASCGRGNFDGPISLPFVGSLIPNEIDRGDFADINGDGLADFIVLRPNSSPNALHYRLNRGHAGFDPLRTVLGLPNAQAGDAVRWADMNGNGSVDLVISNSARPPGTRVQFLDFVPGVRPHLLRLIDNGLGMVTTMDFESSVAQMVKARNAGQPWTVTMPIALPVVSRITESDSRGNDFVREFTYRDPYYEPAKQEFRGFSLTEAREIGATSAPTKIVKYGFDTGVLADCRKGMVLSQEVNDIGGARFDRVENTVQHLSLDASNDGRQVCFAFNGATDTYVFEQTNNPVHLRTEYQYDNFGNLLHENMHGVVEEANDEVFVEKAYNYDPQIWLMDRMMRRTTRDGQAALAAEELFTYDTRGNLTEQRHWLNTEDRFIRSIQNEYDAFGNVTGIMDANDHGRSIAYDPILHTFPITETVHLESQDLVATAEYDLVLGTVVASEDFAGAQTTFVYDSLCRSTATMRPGGATTTYEYNLSNPVSQIVTRIRENTGSSGTFDRFDYFDGFGRKLGAKVEAENGQWRFIDAVSYNLRKLERMRWLPYHTATPNYEIPDNSMPRHTLDYDAPGRMTRVTNPDGTFARTIYEPLIQHQHDENDTAGSNAFKTLRQDGLNRLVEVIERNGPGSYQTLYVWNPLGNLVEITDAQGNKKTMDYDSIQRSVALADPDRGSMAYEYDDVGNLIRTTDARGQQIVYVYDFANRLATENYLDQGGGAADPVDVQYTYDLPSSQVDFGDGQSGTATFTGGRLSAVADLSGEEHLSYDARGNLIWTVKRIRDPLMGQLASFKTAFTYDAMDRMAELQYPDGDRCAYAYNSASFMESAGGGPGGQMIVTSAAYEPTGQLSQLVHGNGVTTSYTYDNRDRLATLHTVSSPIGDLINYSYIYDPVSNIMRISDNRPSGLVPPSSLRRNTQLFLYDDLHRLTQAKYSPSGDGTPTLGQIDYAYDKIGNMQSQNCPAVGQTGHIADPAVCVGAMNSGGALGSQNRIGRLPGDPPGPHALTATQSGDQFEYDDNGNMTDQNGAALTWDFKDRLVRFQKNDIDARYTYDYTGRRITKLITQGKTTDQTLYVNANFEYRPNRAPTKYVFNGATRLAQVKGTLDPTRPRVQRFWLFEGWNLLTVAVQTTQTVQQLFGTGSQVYAWTGDHYQPVSGNSFAPVATPLWVEVNSPRVVTALGLYEPPTDPVVIPAGQSLIAWPKLEPFVPAEHLLSADLRIGALDALQSRWLTIDPTLPPIIADFVKALPSSTAAWFSASTENMLLPEATEDREVLFYHGDHLASAHVMTGLNGTTAQESYNYPFGAVRHTHEPIALLDELYGFTQKEKDAESELHYFEARYLGSAFSRFLSADPKFSHPGMLSSDELSTYLAEPQKINLYSYVQNNPVKFTDPLGLDAQSELTSNAKTAADVASNIDNGANALEGLFEATGKTSLGGYGGAATYLKGAGFVASGVSVGASTVSFVQDPSVEGGNTVIKNGAILGVQIAAGPAGMCLAATDFAMGTVYRNSPGIHDAANSMGDMAVSGGATKVQGGMVAAGASIVLTAGKVGMITGGGPMGGKVFDVLLSRPTLFLEAVGFSFGD